ncbi:MAG: helix-turn-helix domain-containing protein [Microthrixaceae bacterium]
MPQDEGQLIESALMLLADRVPPGWTVEQVQGQGAGSGEGDVLFTFTPQSSGASGHVIVEAKRNFAAVDVERLLGGLTRRLREASGDRPILLVSEFLSSRTRELLAQEDISFLDLTGNTRLVMRNPPMFVETTGSDRRPKSSTSKRSAGLNGVAAWRVIRFLAEVEPPYGVLDIETETGISRGYVSRVLDRLADEALIRRETRGPVESVDWPAMLRQRGQAIDLFKVNTVRGFISPKGAQAAFESLARSGMASRSVVTGSFAAVRLAPVASPALLALYLKPDGGLPFFDEAQSELNLLPADEGADVMLMWPPNDRVVEDTRTAGGIEFVNLPQLAVDCLGGSGRMPAEGEALIEWMQKNPREWQWDSLTAYRQRARR